MTEGSALKLSRRDRAILAQLDRGEAYGLDLVRAKVASRGSVYVVLMRLEDRGFIHRTMEEDNVPPPLLPRHRFAITERGREALAAHPVVPVAQIPPTRWRRLLQWLTRSHPA